MSIIPECERKTALIPQDHFLTSDEVCRILSVRRIHLYELIRRDEIKSIRVGRLHRFRPSDVSDYVEKQSLGAAQ